MQKEGRKEQARSYKQQSKATQHTQGSHLYLKVTPMERVSLLHLQLSPNSTNLHIRSLWHDSVGQIALPIHGIWLGDWLSEHVYTQEHKCMITVQQSKVASFPGSPSFHAIITPITFDPTERKAMIPGIIARKEGEQRDYSYCNHFVKYILFSNCFVILK